MNDREIVQRLGQIVREVMTHSPEVVRTSGVSPFVKIPLRSWDEIVRMAPKETPFAMNQPPWTHTKTVGGKLVRYRKMGEGRSNYKFELGTFAWVTVVGDNFRVEPRSRGKYFPSGTEARIFTDLAIGQAAIIFHEENDKLFDVIAKDVFERNYTPIVDDSLKDDPCVLWTHFHRNTKAEKIAEGTAVDDLTFDTEAIVTSHLDGFLANKAPGRPFLYSGDMINIVKVRYSIMATHSVVLYRTSEDGPSQYFLQNKADFEAYYHPVKKNFADLSEDRADFAKATETLLKIIERIEGKLKLLDPKPEPGNEVKEQDSRTTPDGAFYTRDPGSDASRRA